MQTTQVLGIEVTRLTLNGQPFFYQGLSFFNAVYNPVFNRSPEERLVWLRKFAANGVTALRVWCQWDFSGCHSQFIDAAPDHIIYTEDGEVREHPFQTLTSIIRALGSLDAVSCTLAGLRVEQHPNSTSSR